MVSRISRHSNLYALMFFNLIFLAALIFTLVLTTSDHKCVFPDKKLCFSDLVNEVKTEGGYFVELTQKTSPSHLTNNQFVKFDYLQDAVPSSFDLVLNHTDNVPNGGTNYPDPGSSFSGYHIFTHGNGGVSIYLNKYYNLQPGEWKESYKVVLEGMNSFIDEHVNDGDSSINAQTSAIYQGFDYSCAVYSYKGPLGVSSSATGTSSYFNQFKDTNQIKLKRILTSPHQYNPFNDFYLYKSSRAWSPNNQRVPLQESDNSYKCIDPGAIGLPSCRSIYIPGKGYLTSSGDYSRNCSNGDSIKDMESLGARMMDANSTRKGQLLLPVNSASQKAYEDVKKDTEKLEILINKIKIGPSLVTKVYDGVNFIDKLFYPNAIFCAKGNYSSQEYMYEKEALNNSVIKDFEGSSVANTGTSVDGLFTLGFN